MHKEFLIYLAVDVNGEARVSLDVDEIDFSELYAPINVTKVNVLAIVPDMAEITAVQPIGN